MRQATPDCLLPSVVLEKENSMYDVIVVGARCAGSATALLLARKGYQVLVVDKATFPSDTISTHYIHQPGVSLLNRWGLLGNIVASNCPPIERTRVDFGPAYFTANNLPSDGINASYAPRRTVLDLILVDACVEAGAEVRQGFVVEDLVWDGERVTGIRGHAQGGSTVTESASLVIGADGMRSLVAEAVHAPTYNETPPLTCNYYAYFSGVPLDGVELYMRERRMFGGNLTNDGLTGIIVIFPNAEFHEFRADIEGNFFKTLDLAPDFAERVRQGKREEPWKGMANVANFFRKPYGPGWALVGDAGYFKDPITAQGITDAFHSAELLVEAVDDGFCGRIAMEDALAAYERRRNESVTPMYQLTCQFASMGPPSPAMQQLLAALVHNPTEADRFVGTISGVVPIPEFYAPANLQRIVGQALSA
jgi:flavin-dependent dehydrogenase